MKKSTKRNHKRKGFTLVELIAVMAILGILALLVIPRFTEMTDSSKLSVFENTARSLSSAAGMYAAQNNATLPTDIDELDPWMPSDYAGKLGVHTETYVISGTDIICTFAVKAGDTPKTCTFDMVESTFESSWK